MVVAAGGDGTVNGVASALVGAKAVLGVLPMGTLNHFAKDLGIPLDLEAAVGNLFTGTTVRVDVGEVNGKRFLNNSSIGLYPAIVRQRDDNQTRGHSKWIAFAAATFYVLRRYSPLYVSLQAKGKPGVEEETPFVFVGNNQYKVSGLNIGERACLNAGRLWVYRAPRATRLALFRLALHAFRGWHDPGELEVVDVGELEIQTRKKRLHVSTDGEVGTFTSPLEYRILPKAISVIVPASTCVHSGN
jgi:diacylglycerol kinase family enzyme